MGIDFQRVYRKQCADDFIRFVLLGYVAGLLFKRPWYQLIDL